MMNEYYKDYLKWYAEVAGVERNIEDLPIRQDYQKRMWEVQKALKSTDTKEQMIALDNAINQWHRDYPVIAHFGFAAAAEEDDPELVDLVNRIAEILNKLGRLPKESPYAKIKENVSESSIDFPREGLDLAVWNKEDDSYTLREDVKKKILAILEEYPDIVLKDIVDTIHIVGSIGTNLYEDDCDIDVHVIPKDFTGWNEKKVREVWNWFNDHRDEINGYVEKHPIEIWIQTDVNQDLLSDGCYDLLVNKWKKGPMVVPMDYDPYEDFSHIADDIRAVSRDADILFGELKRDVIDYDVINRAMERMSGEDKKRLLQKLQAKLEEIENDITVLYTKKKSWVDIRTSVSKPATPEQALKDVELAKKWRDTNATFKFVNRYHYLRTINLLKELLGDDEITPDEIDKIKNIMGV